MPRDPSSPAPHLLHLQLNGQTVRLKVPQGRSALHLLREDLGITSLKAGCSQGACGACTVLVGDRPRLTCTLPARALEGQQVTTLEGVPEDLRAAVVDAFISEGGFQCGFCTPGIVLRALSVTDPQAPPPTEEVLRRALQAHICRCTGWEGILRSLDRLARVRRGLPPVAALDPGGPGIGASAPRYDGSHLVLGERPFIDDMIRPGMLHGALVLSPVAHGRLRALDVGRALAHPGVRAIATAADFPGQLLHGPIVADQPAMIPLGGEIRCASDVLAAVAADTREQAQAAAALVVADIEPLPAITDLEEAAKDPARILSTSWFDRGDVDAAISSSAAVVEEVFHTQRVDHAFLEPEATLVVPRADGVFHVWSNSQGIFDDRRHLARLMGWPLERVHVELVQAGGAFGGREDLSVQHHALLLSWMTGRPVKLVLDMAEGLRIRPKRHPMILRYRVGADDQGHLLGLQADILGDTGGWATIGAKVLERAAGHATGAYAIPNVRVRARAVLTHNPVSGAMRGFGVNQAAFALEGCVDRLAEQLGLDPLEMRLRNVLRAGDLTGSGAILGTEPAAAACLEALRPTWEEARAAGRPAGVAIGMKSVGLGNGAPERGVARIDVISAHEVVLYAGFTEMGQGHDTVLLQAVAEVTGLPLRILRVRCTTSADVDMGMTTASRGTWLGVHGARLAARALADAVNGTPNGLEDCVGKSFEGLYHPAPTRPLGTEKARLHHAWTFAAQVALLDPDGRLARVVAAQDVGRALNPLQCRGQVEGAVHMGVGYALSEICQVREGIPETRYGRLGVLRATQTPSIQVHLVEMPESAGPWGARGIGEVGLVPTAPAVASALHARDGVWRSRLPLDRGGA